MPASLFPRYFPILRTLSKSDLEGEVARPCRLLVESQQHRGKRIDVAYAPFDHVNPSAKIVIVGITPGRQQMRNALVEAHRLLTTGHSDAEALSAAKVYASFSGPMRSNLVALLDKVGVNRILGITTTASLWAENCSLAHFTSALRYPVFIDGADYSGTPPPASTETLRRHLRQWFLSEAQSLSDALFVPLGPKVASAVEAVANEVGIDRKQILSGLPHPSGANAERIAFFLGRKERAALSSKVVPDRIMADRETVLMKVYALH